jgi:hypothetical protein
MVDAVQSHGASLAVAVVALGAVFFGAAMTAFEPVALVAAVASAASFFLPISIEVSWELWFLGAAAMGRGSKGRRRAGWQGEMSKSLDPLYKRKVTLDLG